MANELLSFQTILREAMTIFENNCVAAKCVNRKYENKLGDFGDTFMVPIPETPIVSDGPTLALKDTAPAKVTVTLDKQKHTDFTFTSKERALNIDQFSDLFLRPRMEALANQVDVDILALTSRVSQAVGTAANGPNNVLTPRQAAQKLVEHSVPQGDRFMFMNPGATSLFLGTASTGVMHLANPGIPAGEAFRKGYVTNVAGFDLMESPNLPAWTSGADIVGTVNDAAIAEGDTVITTAAMTTTVGSVVEFVGCNAVNPVTKQDLGYRKQFVVTAVNGNDWTVSPPFYTSASGPLQNCTAMPTNGQAPVFSCSVAAGTTYQQSVGFHRDAFGLVTADLVMPEGVDVGARRSHKGISMRLVRDYDIVNDRFPCRIDILYGVVAYRPATHAVRIFNV